MFIEILGTTRLVITIFHDRSKEAPVHVLYRIHR